MNYRRFAFNLTCALSPENPAKLPFSYLHPVRSDILVSLICEILSLFLSPPFSLTICQLLCLSFVLKIEETERAKLR